MNRARRRFRKSGWGGGAAEREGFSLSGRTLREGISEVRTCEQGGEGEALALAGKGDSACPALLRQGQLHKVRTERAVQAMGPRRNRGGQTLMQSASSAKRAWAAKGAKQ